MFKRISILPGISILAIVIEHAIVFGLYALFAWQHRYQAFLPSGYDPIKTPNTLS
jgi:hypothetical protein